MHPRIPARAQVMDNMSSKDWRAVLKLSLESLRGHHSRDIYDSDLRRLKDTGYLCSLQTARFNVNNIKESDFYGKLYC